jgi:hypothetical protein
MIIPPSLTDYQQANGFELEYSVSMDIQKYHRMRYLLLKTGNYCYEHDSRDKHNKTVLNEIGSL